MDYAGVCNGRAVVFDAKETKGKSFPLQAAWLGAKRGERKSIPLVTFEESASEVKSMDGYTLHYLLPFIESRW